jgi:phosphomannomutase/phosphoglucomutase
MREDKDIIFAGEVSGHFYFVEDYYRIDDGLRAGAYIVSLAAKSTEPLSALFSQFPKTVMTPELKLPCDDKLKHQIVDEITKHFSAKFNTITMDGVRIVFSQTSWGLIRASNTSPYLTIRVEADTEAEVIKIKNILADQLERYPEITDKLDRQHAYSHTGKLEWV